MSNGGNSGGSSTLYGTFTATETPFSFLSSIQSTYVIEPFKVLQELVNTLQKNDVAGPLLLRTATEYTDQLGVGAYSEVYGAGWDARRKGRILAKNGDIPQNAKLAPAVIAIKQHRSRGKAPASRNEAQEFLAKHFKDALREIVALTHPKLRTHPNIVKLLAWGLCLDRLEDDSMDKVNIPLLVLEKADGDLFTILQHDARSAVPHVGLESRFKLCADIGSGLQALHSLPLSHGDLKTSNILLFSSPTHGLRAKLCDFGTANAHGPLSQLPIKCSRYRGTVGWRAPEVLQAHDETDSILCDVYTYGLVVWSVLANAGRACLDPETEESPDVLNIASAQLRTCLPADTNRQKQLKTSILRVMAESLRHDPGQRARQPWQHLEQSSTKVTHHYGRIVNSLVTDSWRLVKCRVAKLRIWTVRQRSRMPLLPQQKRAAYAAFTRDIGFENIIAADVQNTQTTDLNAVDVIEHTSNTCLDLSWLKELHEQLHKTLKRKLDLPHNEDQSSQKAFYCYARYRSRLRRCCWATNVTFQHNMIGTYLRYTSEIDFGVFSWLCRGQVAAVEVANLDTADLEFQLSSQKFNESQRLECFLLLLQAGLAVGAPSGKGKPNRSRTSRPSILRNFINTFSEASMGYAMRLICARFKYLQACGLASKDVMNFMLGARTQKSTVMLHWSALHEFAADLNYEAVESLMEIGADPKAVSWSLDASLDPSTVEASVYILTRKVAANHFVLADPLWLSNVVRPDTRAQALSKERLKALFASSRIRGLEGSTSLNLVRVSDDNALPQGWSEHKAFENLNKPKTANENTLIRFFRQRFAFGRTALIEDEEMHKDLQTKVDIVYCELFTGSITWKKPSFSLLSGGRVALGYRRMQGYYLDLVSFLTPQPSGATKKSIEARFPLINDAWYRQEPLEEMSSEDPLADLQEPWTSRFMIVGAPDLKRAARGVVTGVAWVALMVFMLGYIFLTAMWIDYGIRQRRHLRHGDLEL